MWGACVLCLPLHYVPVRVRPASLHSWPAVNGSLEGAKCLGSSSTRLQGGDGGSTGPFATHSFPMMHSGSPATEQLRAGLSKQYTVVLQVGMCGRRLVSVKVIHMLT